MVWKYAWHVYHRKFVDDCCAKLWKITVGTVAELIEKLIQIRREDNNRVCLWNDILFYRKIMILFVRFY